MWLTRQASGYVADQVARRVLEVVKYTVSKGWLSFFVATGRPRARCVRDPKFEKHCQDSIGIGCAAVVLTDEEDRDVVDARKTREQSVGPPKVDATDPVEDSAGQAIAAYLAASSLELTKLCFQSASRFPS
jgi:hypothetical protein